jgi:hypothetical protein
MRFYIFRNWLLKKLNVSKRLQRICLWYIISLMITTRKHSLEHASAISGKNSSQFSRLLKEHPDTTIYTLKDLSRRQGKKYSKAMKTLGKLPWKVAMLVDLTGQGRSSLHSENVQRHNHGKGYFVGHQWTNIVLLINDMIIPLLPIAFLSRNYCRQKNLEYKSEHKRVIDYLQSLDLSEYIENYKPEEVVVLADSGYDDKRIQKVILSRGWDFIMAVKKRRSVKSNAQYLKTSSKEGWAKSRIFSGLSAGLDGKLFVSLRTDQKKAEGVPHQTYHRLAQKCCTGSTGMLGKKACSQRRAQILCLLALTLQPDRS